MKALGFRPDLDREFIYEKVEGIMQDMQMSNLAYFSNSTEGHMIASQVASECSRQNLYDQATIILEIMRVVQPDKSLFWQSKASGAMVETLDVVNQKEVSADWWEN
jgi:Zn-dependent M32 family carboxypeptidase